MTAIEQLRPGYKQTDVGTIPEDWQHVTVADLAARKPNSIVGGPFGSDLVSNDYVPYGVPVIRGQNMGSHFVSGDFVFVSPEKAKYLKANTAAPRDIVFTQRGTLGQVAVVPENGFDTFVISQSQMKLTPDLQSYDPEYLLQFFVSNSGQRQILESAIQTGVPHTNLGILKAYKLPAPPLSEQRAIAAALRDVDALIAALDTMIAKKRDIKQAAMQQLLTGKTRLPGFGGEWIPCLFGDAFIFLRNGSNSRSDLSDGGDVGYIHYGDIHGSHSAFLDCSSSSMTRIAGDKVSKLPRVRDGDLVIADASEDYDGVGKSVEVNGIGDGEVVAGLHTILLRGKSEFISDGFKGYLQFIPELKAALIRIASGISVYGISKSNVKAISVLLPPPNEQIAIAGVLSDMDAEIATLETKRDKIQALKLGMMQELLTGRIRLV